MKLLFCSMDFEKVLLEKQSKPKMLEVKQYVLESPELMDALMECFFSKELRLCQRASWPIMHIGIAQPDLIRPHLEEMIRRLPNAQHDAQIRNTVRILEETGVPESMEGEAFELCFQYLLDMKRATAIRAFSLTVLEQIANKHPELKDELISELQFQKNHGSVGFKNRARKVLGRLQKKGPA